MPFADETEVNILFCRDLILCSIRKLFSLSKKKMMSNSASTANDSMILLGICTYTYSLDCPFAECISCIANIVALFTIKPLLKKGEVSTKVEVVTN